MNKRLSILTTAALFLSTAAVIFISCSKGDDPTPTPDPIMVATSIELVSGGSQTAFAEEALENKVEVMVKDQEGAAFAGEVVKFTVTVGSVSAATVTTDTNGKASVIWTLGATVGTQVLTITGTSTLTGAPISVNATANPVMVAPSIELVSGNEQTAEVLATLANPVVILVKDQNDDAIAGTTVSFTVSEGSVSNTTVTTDANGNASVIWTLGGTIGTQTLETTVEGLTHSPVVFSATGNQITVTDFDGNIYNAVVIGNQVWMAENLKTTKYNNGTAISLVTDNTAWSNLTTEAYCWYNNDEATYKNTYGALYNWHTVNTGNLCPTGWHVPSDAEWTTLTDYLGGESVAGGKLKETGTTHWNTPNTGATNETGFTALSGGYRDFSGAFDNIGSSGLWWSATESGAAGAWDRGLGCSDSNVGRNYDTEKFGFSVRCVRD